MKRGILIVMTVLLIPPVFGKASVKSDSADLQKARPNIVFFLVDDMGWQDTSVPFYTEVTELNKRYRTPNMERLASEGMKFTQAYSSAVCSPSRVSLMTGLTAARHRVTNWTLTKNVSPDEDNPKVKSPDWNLNGLSPVSGIPHTIVYANTLPALLKKAGYKTIHVGKAHFGAAGTPGENPLNFGFDVNIGGHAAGGPGSYLGIHDYSADWRVAGDHRWDVPGLEAYHGENIYLTEALTREAIKSVEMAVKDKQPFYLYMSHYAIHAPWEKDERYYQKYIDEGLSQSEAIYATMIEGMDKSLGDIMDELDRLGVAENTIIIFSSDNGAHKQVPQNLPLRGYKLSPYEGGIRVPMIVKWPGVVKPESVTKDYVIIEDVYPTFLEMAGLNKDINKSIDGRSFVSLLKGYRKTDSDRALLWHYPNTYYNPPYTVVRQGDWKLIYHHISGQLELFNLAEDIGETNDLSVKLADKTSQLAVLMTKLLKDTEAQMPIEKATGLPIAYPSAL
ncbi:sulfatase [Algoriphagus chordae]|uniref:Arylsulfatase A-like enzyme n=1 Tax=Algoriphagus chordae TaxID=237019 RepID=A0A2W7RDN9_9BACT|nr:sulfatase [Algoriphagus chordae]PZX56480.1 arylsulfatase A-like enzyme [Algoriphagus chordae]